MAHVALTARKRTEFGNGPTRRLRRQGLVPGVVYQPGSPSMAFALSERELRRALAEGRTSVVDLTVEGDHARPVLLKDWQLDPVRGDVLHVDFQEVDLTQEVEAPVAITLVGSSIGVREGGVLDQPLREVIVRALPDALPDHLELDVSELDVGDSISVEGLTAPEGIEIVTEPETVVASVLAPTVEVEEEEEPEEGEEAEEGAEAAEGEEAPAGEPQGTDSEE
jgi:large subunit ribosomal protein L25